MATSEQYRKYAAECVALAQKAVSVEDRARLLEMAQQWLELADKSERGHPHSQDEA
jgi:hypothetical protein